MTQHNGSSRRDHSTAHSDRASSDQTLRWLLERAGERWGVGRVAAAAAALVRSDAAVPGQPWVATESRSWVKTYHPDKRRQYRA